VVAKSATSAARLVTLPATAPKAADTVPAVVEDTAAAVLLVATVVLARPHATHAVVSVT